jgi:hypothetical protein
MFFLPADLRIADADREAVVELIKRHYAVGRLSDAEMSARVEAAYAARYESQLERLIWDLPDLPPDRGTVRRSASGALAPAAAAGGLAVGGVALASVLPPELWAMLLPLVLMGLFTVAPVALPVLVVLWLARGLGRPHELRRGPLPPRLPR